jgi:hypothetical protein
VPPALQFAADGDGGFDIAASPITCHREFHDGSPPRYTCICTLPSVAVVHYPTSPEVNVTEFAMEIYSSYQKGPDTRVITHKASGLIHIAMQYK